MILEDTSSNHNFIYFDIHQRHFIRTKTLSDKVNNIESLLAFDILNISNSKYVPITLNDIKTYTENEIIHIVLSDYSGIFQKEFFISRYVALPKVIDITNKTFIVEDIINLNINDPIFVNDYNVLYLRNINIINNKMDFLLLNTNLSYFQYGEVLFFV